MTAHVSERIVVGRTGAVVGVERVLRMRAIISRGAMRRPGSDFLLL